MQPYAMSHWEWDAFFRDVDVAVVGSGIVGITAALHLRTLAPAARIVILERGPLPIGASTRNAGFACFGSLSELIDDMDHRTEQEVWDLVERRYHGLEFLKTLVGPAQMDYREWGGYELFGPDDEAIFQRCLERFREFNERLRPLTGLPETFVLRNEDIGRFGFRSVRNLIFNPAEGQIHPGKMMARLIRLAGNQDIPILTGIEVTGAESLPSGVVLRTAGGWELQVSRVLYATNGLTRQLLPAVAVTPARNQVLITRPVEGLPIRGCFHYDRGYYYFRNVGNRVLLGGGRNIDLANEQTHELGQTTVIQQNLLRMLREVILPETPFEVERWWSGILGVGPAKTPIIERLDDRQVLAVRLGGVGIAIGTGVGRAGAELLLRS